ncbi:MAG: hypothetical protein ACOYJ2_03945 [Rickettsiales bacterium]
MQHSSTEKPPIIFVDTGTLLTLLLGHHEELGYRASFDDDCHDSDMPPNLGYASLLLALAKQGLVDLRLTDMVVAEFLGLQSPVYADDLKGRHPNLKPEHIPSGFQFRQERLTLLRALLKTGHAEIVPTKAGTEQLDRAHALLQVTKEEKRSAWDESGDADWLAGEVDKEALRVHLLDSGSKLTTAMRRHNLMPKPGDINPDYEYLLHNAELFFPAQLYANYSDRGEMSIADAIHEAQTNEPDRSRFVLFEGSDVRGRIIQRLIFNKLSDEGRPIRHVTQDQKQGEKGQTDLEKPYIEAYHYHQVGKPRARYNPNLPTFQSKGETYVDKIGDFNFLTTKSFLHGVMQSAANLKKYKKAGIENADRFYILAEDETSNLDGCYEQVIEQVCSNGLPRQYDREHDEHISNVVESPNGQSQNTEHPWQHYVMQPEYAQQLVVALNSFADYRDQEFERYATHLFEHAVGQASELSPEMMERFLHRLRDGLGQCAAAQRIAGAIKGRGE